jgi:hypothetical protein
MRSFHNIHLFLFRQDLPVFAEASVFALRATTRQVRLRLRLQSSVFAFGYALTGRLWLRPDKTTRQDAAASQDFQDFFACLTASGEKSKNLNPYSREFILILDNPILKNSSSDYIQYTEIS